MFDQYNSFLWSKDEINLIYTQLNWIQTYIIFNQSKEEKTDF